MSLYATRRGEWLELDPNRIPNPNPLPGPDLQSNEYTQLAPLRAGSHPHEVRQWLLARSFLPERWINRLFSVGGIRWSPEGRIQLHAFPSAARSNVGIAADVYRDWSGSIPSALYEDDYCLVMNKPAGMPVHGAFKGQKGTLDDAAERHMAAKGDPLPVRHIHRLDDDTSGPVLYATNDLAQLRLDEAMRHKAIDRRYIAIVEGELKKRQGTVSAPIGKDRHHKARRRVTPSGDPAVTHYEAIGHPSGGLSAVRVRLETGRTHQIRVHMSHIGHPLLGDTLYGGSAKRMAHQALHGERLLFPHPLTGAIVEAAAPWPEWLSGLAKELGLRQ